MNHCMQCGSHIPEQEHFCSERCCELFLNQPRHVERPKGFGVIPPKEKSWRLENCLCTR